MKLVFLSHRIYYFMKLQRWHIGNIFPLLRYSLFYSMIFLLTNHIMRLQRKYTDYSTDFEQNLKQCVQRVYNHWTKKWIPREKKTLPIYANVAVSRSNKFGEIKRLTSSFDSQKVLILKFSLENTSIKNISWHILEQIKQQCTQLLKRLTTMLSSSRTATTK